MTTPCSDQVSSYSHASFCDEVFASNARNRDRRVSLGGQMFGLRIEARNPAKCRTFSLPRPLPSPEKNLRLALPSRECERFGLGLMRYRSATVAGFHGLPCYRKKFERTTRARGPRSKGIICARAAAIFYYSARKMGGIVRRHPSPIEKCFSLRKSRTVAALPGPSRSK